MLTAFITTNPEGQLVADSTVTIGGVTSPVLRRTDAAGVFAPKRIIETLTGLGYRPATNYYGDLHPQAGGGLVVDIRPLD